MAGSAVQPEEDARDVAASPLPRIGDRGRRPQPIRERHAGESKPADAKHLAPGHSLTVPHRRRADSKHDRSPQRPFKHNLRRDETELRTMWVRIPIDSDPAGPWRA